MRQAPVCFGHLQDSQPPEDGKLLVQRYDLHSYPGKSLTSRETQSFFFISSIRLPLNVEVFLSGRLMYWVVFLLVFIFFKIFCGLFFVFLDIVRDERGK